MNVVKKNLVSIIFGVIAIIAIIAVFYPVGGMYDDLNKKMDESATVGTKLNQVSTTPRLMPLISPYAEVPTPLAVFPSPAIIKKGIDATKELSKESEDMFKVAVAKNQHVLILVGSLPKPDSNVISNWSELYVKLVTGDSRWRDKLNAGMKPTAAAIDAKKLALHTDIMRAVATADDATQKEAEQNYQIQAVRVKPKMDMDVATEKSIYLETAAFASIFDLTIGIGAGKHLPEAGEIWDAQLAIWVIDDVTDAIARSNRLFADPAGPGGPPVTDIIHDPIKQLVSMDKPVFVPPANPADLLAGQTTPVPSAPAVSVTGHVSNGMYDVYRFNLVMDVDAAKVAQVLRELEVDKFITVLNCQITALDLATLASSGFMYGNKPVVRLDLQCEQLMLHSWTDELIPETRKGGKGATGASPVFTPQPGGGFNDNGENIRPNRRRFQRED